MKRCAVIANDLMTWSRLQGTVTAAGFTPFRCRDATALAGEERVHAVVVDLTDPAGGVDAVRTARSLLPEARLVAFGPHVRTDLMEAAKAAGADATVPNSALVARLAPLLQGAPS